MLRREGDVMTLEELKKELVQLRVEWIVHAEGYDTEYASGCIQCAGDLGQILKKIMSNDEYQKISKLLVEEIERHCYGV